MQFISFTVIWKRIKAIRHMMKDSSVHWLKKALVVFGIAYLLLPIDLIPVVIPVFGILDDVILWAFILYFLRDELDKYDNVKPVEKVRRYNTKGKTVYETTGRIVEDEE